MFVLGPKRLVLAIVLLVPLVVVPRLRAQVPNAPQQNTPAREEASDDPLGRSTPHGAVLGFIRAAGRGDYDQAASYLNTTDLLIVALAISVALLAHLIDIGVWAVLFVMCGEFFGVPSRVLPLSGQLHHLGVR